MLNNETDAGKSILVKTYEGKSSKEILMDYNLPDYLPDINRLLKVGAEITDESRYLSGDMLEYDGKMKFSVLYATSDGRLENATFDTDFSGNAAVSGTMGDCDIRMIPEVEAVTCRLQNPRKLTAKAKLSASIAVFCRKSTAPTVSGRLTPEEEAGLQYRTRTIESTVEMDAEATGESVSEDIELDAAMPAMEKIIAVELTPFITDARAGDGKVTYKGEVMAQILYCAKSDEMPTEDKPTPPTYVAFAKNIPISGETAVEALCDGAVPMVSIRIDNTEFRPQENAFGESRTVEIDFDYSVAVRAFCREESEIVTDMYSTEYESTEEYDTLSYETVQYGKSFNFSASGSTQRDDADFDRIVATTASATITDTAREGSKLIFQGHAELSVILTNGAGVYQTKNFEVPFRAETDAARLGESFRILPEAYVMACSSRLDDEKLYSDPEILISYVAFACHSEKAVSASAVCKDHPVPHRPSASLTLYYPTADDTLWSIAKKYRTTVDALSAENGMSADVLSGVLVIPKPQNGKASYSKVI